MKKLLASLALATTVHSLTLNCDGNITAGIDVLYWKPCEPNAIYARATNDTPSANPTTVESLGLQPGYDWGFRLQVGYLDCCGDTFYNLSWIYLRGTDTSGPNGPFASLTIPIIPEATSSDTIALARLKHRYNRVDLRAGHFAQRTCSYDTYLLGGLLYVNIEDHTKIEGIDFSGVAEFQGSSKLNGVAGELGIGGNFHLCGQFGCTLELGLFAGVGRRKLGWETLRETNLINLDFPSETHCLTGYDFKVGIHYSCSARCVNTNIEIGWEQQYYFNALRRPTYTDESSSASHDVGYGGPYLSFSFFF
jgi:hypothetical protein